MRVPLEWLKDYVAVRMAPKALAERLTMAGHEVVAIDESAHGPILDLEITPNRPDCLSIIGIAREVAAITGQRLQLPAARGSGLRARGKHRKPPTQSPKPRAQLAIRIEDRKGCLRYIGRLIEGVTVASSPEWMQRRLLACGARPIHLLVDITNYVLFEYGQPLHAFDFDRLAGGTIIVRRARPQERLTTLDGAARTLSPETLVIADAERVVAVAGVIGGADSAVSSRTTRVLLEAALFDPVTVRRTARGLGLATESSYRFERGVDPLGAEAASSRAGDLITQLAGGREVAVADVGAKTIKRRIVTLETARMTALLGMPTSLSTIRTTLARLSCRVASGGAGEVLRVEPPPARRDLLLDVDFAEEVARLGGYDRLPSRLPMGMARSTQTEPSVRYRQTQSLKCLCASLGLTEAITWSLRSEAELARWGMSNAAAIRLANPLSQDHAVLRPSLLIGLLQAVRHNLLQGVADVRFFEVGCVMARREGQDVEQLRLGLALSGVWTRDWHTNMPSDFFRLKGLLMAILQRLCQAEPTFAAALLPWAQPRCSTTVLLHRTPIGVAGEMAKSLTRALDIEQSIWMAEVSVDAMLQVPRGVRTVATPPAFPPVKRDLSVLLEDRVAFADVDRTIRETAGPLAARISLIDRYSGTSLPRGTHSLTFSIEYRDPARTLTAAEVDALHRQVSQALTSRLGATLR